MYLKPPVDKCKWKAKKTKDTVLKECSVFVTLASALYGEYVKYVEYVSTHFLATSKECFSGFSYLASYNIEAFHVQFS